MIAFGDLLLKEEKLASASTVVSAATASEEEISVRGPFSTSTRDQQISGLVQQLFLDHRGEPLRRVAFAPIETSPEPARLCFDAARILVEQTTYEVGLIDATFDGPPLQSELRVPSPAKSSAPWTICPRLWMVPRQSWLQGHGRQPVSDSNLERLRDLTTEFDFCILRCPPVSWLTVRLSRTFDGLVLILIANRTRRLVAAQIKEQLIKTQIPLLGTVLAERRFPLPNGLYRSL